ncbi:hypothetical protein ABC383_04010 [Noviherbaspirillum sp. 1P10PC]
MSGLLSFISLGRIIASSGRGKQHSAVFDVTQGKPQGGVLAWAGFDDNLK